MKIQKELKEIQDIKDDEAKKISFIRFVERLPESLSDAEFMQIYDYTFAPNTKDYNSSQ